MTAPPTNHPAFPVITDYIESCKESHVTPTLKQFFDKHLVQAAANTDLRLDLKRTWTKRFRQVAQSLQVNFDSSEDVDWGGLKTQMQSIITASKAATTTSSKRSCSGDLMTDEAFAEVNKMYGAAITSNNVWRLATGTVVEEVMRNVAMATTYENPVHSLIINPDDPIYTGKFSDEELQEIREHKVTNFDEQLPQELSEYLKSFKGITKLADLNDAIMAKEFHATKQPDLFWAKETLQQAINLFNYGSLHDDFVEDDIEYRIWFFIAKCFYSTAIRATSGKKKSQASTEQSVTRQVSECQSDMKYVYLNHELAFSEVGLYDDGTTGTEELPESGLKAPKMLKDFFSSVTAAYPNIVRQTRTAAFIISGFHISVIIMDSPAGSVCRLTYTERAQFPQDPSLCIKQLVPIMELVYRVRGYLLNTVKAITEDQEPVSIGRRGTKRPLIPSAIVSPHTTSPSSSSSSPSNTATASKKYKH